jgi:hypothetical protein
MVRVGLQTINDPLDSINQPEHIEASQQPETNVARPQITQESLLTDTGEFLF